MSPLDEMVESLGCVYLQWATAGSEAVDQDVGHETKV